MYIQKTIVLTLLVINLTSYADICPTIKYQEGGTPAPAGWEYPYGSDPSKPGIENPLIGIEWRKNDIESSKSRIYCGYRGKVGYFLLRSKSNNVFPVSYDNWLDAVGESTACNKDQSMKCVCYKQPCEFK